MHKTAATIVTTGHIYEWLGFFKKCSMDVSCGNLSMVVTPKSEEVLQ